MNRTRIKRTFAVLVVIVLLAGLLSAVRVGAQVAVTPGFHSDNVPIYGAFELPVVNNNSYSNKFDYTVIELSGDFTSPSGYTYTAHGFYDGDGSGGQNGNVWRLRFMPTELGTWTYTYYWTDGTPGGSGSFDCVASDYRGPLVIDSDKPWYFKTMDGQPFHAKGYDLHQLGPMGVLWGPSNQPAPIYEAVDWSEDMDDSHIAAMDNYMVPGGYNLTMLGSANNENYPPTYWINDNPKVFNVKVWKVTENIYVHARERGIYAFQFDGLVRLRPCQFGGDSACQTLNRWNKQIVRYNVARLSSISSHTGYNPTRENYKLPNNGYSKAEMDELMTFAQDSIPTNYGSLLTIHDNMYQEFANWQDYAIRQHPSKHLEGNSKSSQTGNNNDRGVDIDSFYAPYDFPVIGAEDVWEGLTQKGLAECIRPLWGQMMGGIIPLYSEWNRWINVQGTGVAEEPYRKGLDWWFENVDYRDPDWQKMNNLISSNNQYEVGGGIPNQEYVAYREGNGSITINLSGASGTFDVSWFNPFDGVAYPNHSTTTGGGSRTLSPPFGSDDVVVLLKKQGVNACFSHTVRPGGLTVDFDASCSGSTGGTITDYDWDFGDGSPNGSGETTSHTYATGAEYTVTLTVTDDQNSTDSVSRVVDARPPTPTPVPTNTPVPTATPTPTDCGYPLNVTGVTASADDGNVPENTLDGDLNTRWSAEGDPQWIEFALAEEATVKCVYVAFFKGDQRAAFFDIETAAGNVFGGNSSANTLQLEEFVVAPSQTTYVRYVGHGNSANGWNSLTEVEIWGEVGPPPTATPVPPTDTPAPPTDTPIPPTPTATPSGTPIPPTNTPAPPTDTPIPPTPTATPSGTPIPPTDTPAPPTDTPIPPTGTPIPPTDTPVPPTPTPAPYVINDPCDSLGDYTEVLGGNWSASGGRCVLSSPASSPPLGNILVHDTTVSGDFTLTAVAQVSNGSAWDDFAILFGYQDANNYYYAAFNEQNDGLTNGIFQISGGSQTELVDFAQTTTAGVDHDIEIVCESGSVTVKRDGVTLGSASGVSCSGQVGFGSRNNASEYDDLYVTGSAPVPPTDTPVPPTDTPIPPTNTPPPPTDTPPPPTSTPVPPPTDTPPPPTDTPPPPPTDTPPPYIIDDPCDSLGSYTEVLGGSWSASGGRCVLSSPANAAPLGNILVHDTTVGGDFTLTVVAQVSNGSSWDDFAIIFGYQDADNYAYAAFNEQNDGLTNGIFEISGGVQTELVDFSQLTSAGQDHDIEIVCSGGTVTVKRDGVTLGSVSGLSCDGQVGFGSRNNACEFDSLLVQ